MNTTLTTAVHCFANGADSHTSPHGDTVTAVVHTPSIPVRTLAAGRIHIPGGCTTAPQLHRTAEATLAVISGYAAVLSGPRMQPALPHVGDMIYIPPSTPYAVVNLSLNASVLLLAFRTDPEFSTDVHRLSDLDKDAEARIDQLRKEHLERLMQQRTGRQPRRRRG